MFSIQQKRDIADAVQKILRATNHPELPSGEIQFHLHVDGAEAWSWADIRNNGTVAVPSVNPWNEAQAAKTRPDLTDEERAAVVEALEYHLKRWPNEDTVERMQSAKEKLK